jgi:acetolactate synthase-1/2/3 large subunit
MMAHGGRLVAEQLKREGVSHLFTLCGGHIQNIYDGCLDTGIRVVDVRHEQTAGHAADGWARVTGQPGVCAVTAGPGVTDVVTALANAQRAGVPMVCIGGAGPALLTDRGSLQDMNHLDLVKSITKASYRVLHTERLPEYISTAFRVATAGVPGPVYLEMPLDILMGFADTEEFPDPATARTRAQPAPDPDELARAVALLEKAERPVLIVGSQLRWSRDEGALAALLARYPMPTFVNGMARGALPLDHPCLFSRSRRAALAERRRGAHVRHALRLPRRLRPRAHVVARHEDHQGRPRRHHPRAQPRRRRGHRRRHGPAPAEPRRRPRPQPDRGAWIAGIRQAEDRSRAKMVAEMASEVSPPNPLRVCAELDKFLDDDSIVIGDGGDFVATAAYVTRVRRPGLWMDPGPLGTLGVGPGYAMAAKLARPKSKVVLVYGDGAFGLHAMELEAMARQGIPVVCVIGNDAGWTQIRRGQVEFFGEERAVATGLAYTRYDRWPRPSGASASGSSARRTSRAASRAPSRPRRTASPRW